jgi:hypothetical protein
MHTIVLVSLTQLVWTMHKICKVWGSNPGHHKKKSCILLGRWLKIRLLLFPSYSFIMCPIYFLRKCPWDFRILDSELSFSIVMRWKKNEFFTNSDFIIRKPQIFFFFQILFDMFLSFFTLFLIIESKHPINTYIGHVHCFFRFIESKHPINTLIQWKNSSDYIIWIVSAQILNMLVTWIVILRIILIFLTLIIMF